MSTPAITSDDYRLDKLNIIFYIESVPFTRDVIEGKTSLGGSESAAVGLAQWLALRGHDVHIFAAQLQLADTDPVEYSGVSWHPAEHLPETLNVCSPDVFIALRMVAPFVMRTRAGLNLLWNQDMLGDVTQVASALAQIDAMVYVSEYHRQQWTGVQQEIIGATPSWVTKNGFDHTLIPVWPEHLALAFERAEEADRPAVAPPARNPHKYCFISRPERGLGVLLKMWPRIRQRFPDAELHLCRYDSMYDAKGWGRVCEQYDRHVEAANEHVGGITWHGNLNKPALYQLLTSCRLMLYPGVVDFAETNCLAAVEAQACGCVLIGSYKGALPETLGQGAGILIDGDANTEAYQDSFIEAVYTLSGGDDDENGSEAEQLYRDMQAAGQRHVYPAYTFETLAGEWEAWLLDTFRTRYETEKVKVMRRLLHDDHHVAAKMVAQDFMAGKVARSLREINEVIDADKYCDRVIAQLEQTAEDYATFSIDTEAESRIQGRFTAVIEYLKEAGARTVLDVACGNGSFALAALRAIPDLHVTCVDYSHGVLDKARTALDANGMGGRYFLHQADLSARPPLLGPLVPGPTETHFDAVFCGEYLEHTAEPHLVLDWLESHVRPGGLCIITCPHGPLTEHIPFRTRIQRGHTHHFQLRDIMILFQNKTNVRSEHMDFGTSPRGNACGFWIVQWERPTNCPGCGAGEAEVHRPKCPVFLKTLSGPVMFTCPRCQEAVNTMVNGVCPLCAHLCEHDPTGPDASPFIAPAAVPCDHWHTILTTRPYQRLVAALIVRDAEEWLFKCLHSIWPLVDAIVIVDTGSTDGTKAVAAQFPNTFIYSAVDEGLDWPTCGFSAARNVSVRRAETDHQADWILWLDADEHVQGGHLLHTLLTGAGPYLGYIIRQHHLMLDFTQFFDVPCRVFRANQGIQFTGLVHEQPETKKNANIFPALNTLDINIVHYGYEDETTRRHKMLTRNLPLLQRELLEDPDPRDLAYVLLMRDLTVLAGYEGAEQSLTPKTIAYLKSVVGYYWQRGYDNPAHRLHPIAYPSYQIALKWLGVGFEVMWAVGAGSPRLTATGLRPERFIARTTEEAESLLAHRIGQLLTPIRAHRFDTTVWQHARPCDVPAPGPPLPLIRSVAAAIRAEHPRLVGVER